MVIRISDHCGEPALCQSEAGMSVPVNFHAASAIL
jgi:hypothetical protein